MLVGDQALQEQNEAKRNPKNIMCCILAMSGHSAPIPRLQTGRTPRPCDLHDSHTAAQSLTDSHCGYLVISLFWL